MVVMVMKSALFLCLAISSKVTPRVTVLLLLLGDMDDGDDDRTLESAGDIVEGVGVSNWRRASMTSIVSSVSGRNGG